MISSHNLGNVSSCFSVLHLKLEADSACSSSGELHSLLSRCIHQVRSALPHLCPDCAQSDLFLDTCSVIYSSNTHSPVAPPHIKGHAVPRVQKVCFLSGGLQLTGRSHLNAAGQRHSDRIMVMIKPSHLPLSSSVFTAFLPPTRPVVYSAVTGYR